MITVILRDNDFFRVSGNPTLTSLDGELRATLATIKDPSWTDADRETFGVYRVDVTPPQGHEWTGTIDNVNGVPTPEFRPVSVHEHDVIAERRRRLALGFDFDFQDSRGVHRIGTTEDDMAGWSEVSLWAAAQQGLGKADKKEIMTNTGPVSISAVEWFRIIDAADAVRQPLWIACFALMYDPRGIPVDYTDDRYWPSAEEHPE